MTQNWVPVGWTYINCDCVGGLVWTGEDANAKECQNCKGAGGYYRHEKTGTLAEYPGGPFLGREPKMEKINDDQNSRAFERPVDFSTSQCLQTRS